MSNKITKKDIENLAFFIADVLKKEGLANDICIYFNNKRINLGYHYDTKTKEIVWEEKIEEDINPHDYFECAYNHILSISTEGDLYDKINFGSGFPKVIENEFKKLSLYYEQWNSWNLSLYSFEENNNIEYTYYNKPKDPIYIWFGENCKNIPTEVIPIMKNWWEKSKKEGDSGGCVVGAYLEFSLKNEKYHMSPCSPWQGEGSWVPHVDWVKEELQKIGATNISWHCGMLD